MYHSALKVWDNIDKKLYFADVVSFEGKWIITSGAERKILKDFLVFKNTEKLDKLGDMICEGDILVSDDGWSTEVYYEDCGFFVDIPINYPNIYNPANKGRKRKMLGIFRTDMFFVIIGHVKTHPELL